MLNVGENEPVSADSPAGLVYSRSPQSQEPLDARMDETRKRLHFRAWRRGFREIDLILGSFADKALPDMGADEVSLFEALLNAPDQDVYDWLAGRAAAPAHFAALIDRIQEVSVPLTRPQ